VLAVDKMDRVGWSEVIFRGMEAQFRDFAATLGIDAVVSIPVAAKSGDNVTSRPIACPGMTGRHCLNIWRM
jgi:sulfate adenylyltransferase subunit 1 (EFTu-like GTPase family)